MKSTLLGGAACFLSTVCALGADMGVPIAIPSAPPPPFSWTGCYAGGQAGRGFGQKNLNDSVGIVSSISGFTSANLNVSGYMLGGQIGCDYQFAPTWVVGIEGAATGGNIHGSTSVATPALLGDSANFRATTDLLTSVTGRVGYAWNNWLLYAKGGAAWASDRYSASDVLATYDFEGLETRFGWTAGAGVEWAFWENWSVKVEYDYFGFGHNTVLMSDSNLGLSAPVDVKQTVQMVRLGLNVHMWSGKW
jgi:outer membrane immunogenic protein